MQIVQLFFQNSGIHTVRLLDEQTYEEFEDDVFGTALESVTVETKLMNPATGNTAWVRMDIRTSQIAVMVKMPADTMASDDTKTEGNVTRLPGTTLEHIDHVDTEQASSSDG